MLFGGSSSQQESQAPVDPYSTQAQGMNPELYGNQTSMQQQASGPCVPQVNGFKQCMESNNSDLNICGWYLDQLKACQAAASKY
jgi:coiled-coil-helix-coiled-coil-helix domain-containing protein 2